MSCSAHDPNAAAVVPHGWACAPVRSVAVTGGKGGVGTSVVATNLAVALGKTTSGVLLFDAALALGNVAPLLGLAPTHHAEHGIGSVLDGHRSLDELLVDGPGGIRVIAASHGDISLSRRSHIDHARLVALFSAAGIAADTLLVDIPSGLSDPALAYASAAREVLIVVTDEPTSLHDAAAVVRELHTRYHRLRFRLVVNRVESARQALDVHAALMTRLGTDTDLLLDFVGAIPDDPHVGDSVRAGVPVVQLHPRSPAARAFDKLATRVAGWPRPASPAGHIEFFVERLIQTSDSTLVRATA